MRKYSILLVDDEETLLETLSLDLLEEGYDVTTASSGAESISLFKKYCFDVVITDLNLGETTGMEVVDEAKKNNPETMVLILTGYASLTTAIEALRLGASDYIMKPCSRKELALRVRNCIEKMEILRKIKIYESILPVCSVCNRIHMTPKDGIHANKWVDFEEYLKDTTGLETSHGYCPTCLDDAKEEIQKAGEQWRKKKEEVKNGSPC